MPQPQISLQSYLANPLPTLASELPVGVGKRIPNPTWEGPLKGVSVIDGFQADVDQYLKEQLPEKPISTHPAKPLPNLQITARSLKLNSDIDMLDALRKLPLESALAVCSAWDLYEHGDKSGEKGKISPAIEADGHELVQDQVGERVIWKFGKTPFGTTEFLLCDAETKPVLAVRAVTENVFNQGDWEEFSVSGEYRYNPKSKASWMWSRWVGGTRRLKIKYFVLTSYTRWAFGIFNDDGSFANISPVLQNDSTSPTVLAALTYWSRSALGHEGGMKDAVVKDVAGQPQLFPSNPARRASQNKGARPRPEKRLLPKLGNESDVEESDIDDGTARAAA